jgi:ABC-type bacteriocin/lantibiotic exporter with double-glycine peptidase domain
MTSENIVYQRIEKYCYCGPSSLSTALDACGVKASQDELAEMAGTVISFGPDGGTTHLGMINAVKSFSTDIDFMAASNLKLKDLEKQLEDGGVIIVNFMDGVDPDEDGHYGILTKIEADKVTILSPTRAYKKFYEIVIDRDDFIEQWHDKDKGEDVRHWALVIKPIEKTSEVPEVDEVPEEPTELEDFGETDDLSCSKCGGKMKDELCSGCNKSSDNCICT